MTIEINDEMMNWALSEDTMFKGSKALIPQLSFGWGHVFSEFLGSRDESRIVRKMKVAVVELGHGIPRCRRPLEKGALSDFPLIRKFPPFEGGLRGILCRIPRPDNRSRIVRKMKVAVVEWGHGIPRCRCPLEKGALSDFLLIRKFPPFEGGLRGILCRIPRPDNSSRIVRKMKVAVVELGHGIPRCRRPLEKGALSDFPLLRKFPPFEGGLRGILGRIPRPDNRSRIVRKMKVAVVELGHGIPRCRCPLEKGALSDFPLLRKFPPFEGGLRGILCRIPRPDYRLSTFLFLG